MQRELKDMSFVEVVNEASGRALMDIGAGRAWREVVLGIVHSVVAWKEALAEAEKVDRQPSDHIIKAKIVNTTVDVAHPQVYTILHGTEFDPNVELVYREGRLIDVKLLS